MRDAISERAAEANAKFRVMFEQGVQFAGILSVEGIVIEANRLSLDACGFTREEVIGKPFWECGWWNRSPAVAERIRATSLAAAAGRTFTLESPYFVADGSERIVDIVLAPVTDDSGRILFVAATGTDITKRKRAEDALRVTNERLKLLVENTKDYAVIISDPEGIVVEWQGGAERIIGYAAEDMVGRTADVIFTPEDRAAGVPALEMAKARENGRAEDKRWHVRADGSRFFADGVMTALYGETGQLRGFGKVFRDATAQKLAEEALRESEERLRLLDSLGEATRSASDPTMIMAVTNRLLGEYLGVSRCAYADLEADADHFTIRADWTAPGITSTVGVYQLARFGSRAVEELRNNRPLVVRDVDQELLPEDGGEMFRAIGIRAIITCPLVKEGRLVAMMAVHDSRPRNWTLQDVALVEQVVDRSWAHIERVRAAAALVDQDRRKDEFLATLAHELRNPLAPLRTGLHVLRAAPSGPEAARARELMERQLGHMVRLVDDLLDISRISRGSFELRRERIQIRAVIDHAIEASRPLIEAAHHELTVTLPDRPVWLDGDLTRLAQVVSNLLNNAAKYTPREGRIEIRVEAADDEVVVQVSDNGTGISEEMLPEVFSLFSQVNQTLSHAQGGLGIGLSLVRRLVEMHGGIALAESAGLGKGSTFTVRLPAERAESSSVPEAPREVTAAGARATQRRRILVVDDNLDGAEMFATMLEITGYETRTAHDGPDALVAAREFAPEVVFLDIGLPGMDGYEVAKRLRADAGLGGTILVALTGWGSADDKRRTKAAGFDFHLTKPVDIGVVQKLLADVPGSSPRSD